MSHKMENSNRNTTSKSDDACKPYPTLPPKPNHLKTLSRGINGVNHVQNKPSRVNNIDARMEKYEMQEINSPIRLNGENNEFYPNVNPGAQSGFRKFTEGAVEIESRTNSQIKRNPNIDLKNCNRYQERADILHYDESPQDMIMTSEKMSNLCNNRGKNIADSATRISNSTAVARDIVRTNSDLRNATNVFSRGGLTVSQTGNGNNQYAINYLDTTQESGHDRVDQYLNYNSEVNTVNASTKNKVTWSQSGTNAESEKAMRKSSHAISIIEKGSSHRTTKGILKTYSGPRHIEGEIPGISPEPFGSYKQQSAENTIWQKQQSNAQLAVQTTHKDKENNVTDTEESLTSSLSELNDILESDFSTLRSPDLKGPTQQNYDDNLLYYDNMDIMREYEKKKMKQKEQRLREFGNDRNIEVTLNQQNEVDIESRTNHINEQNPTQPLLVGAAAMMLGTSPVEEDIKPPALPPKQKNIKRIDSQKKVVVQKSNVVSQNSGRTKEIISSLQYNGNSKSQENTNMNACPPALKLDEPENKTNNQPEISVNFQFHTAIHTNDNTARFRSLVDEPLAPIIEEGSIYDDSSRGSSTVGEDDNSSVGTVSSSPDDDSQEKETLEENKDKQLFGDESLGNGSENPSENDVLNDVTPYGMVDLSVLESPQTYRQLKSLDNPPSNTHFTNPPSPYKGRLSTNRNIAHVNQNKGENEDRPLYDNTETYSANHSTAVTSLDRHAADFKEKGGSMTPKSRSSGEARKQYSASPPGPERQFDQSRQLPGTPTQPARPNRHVYPKGRYGDQVPPTKNNWVQERPRSLVGEYEDLEEYREKSNAVKNKSAEGGATNQLNVISSLEKQRLLTSSEIKRDIDSFANVITKANVEAPAAIVDTKIQNDNKSFPLLLTEDNWEQPQYDNFSETIQAKKSAMEQSTTVNSELGTKEITQIQHYPEAGMSKYNRGGSSIPPKSPQTKEKGEKFETVISPSLRKKRTLLKKSKGRTANSSSGETPPGSAPPSPASVRSKEGSVSLHSFQDDFVKGSRTRRSRHKKLPNKDNDKGNAKSLENIQRNTAQESNHPSKYVSNLSSKSEENLARRKSSDISTHDTQDDESESQSQYRSKSQERRKSPLRKRFSLRRRRSKSQDRSSVPETDTCSTGTSGIDEATTNRNFQSRTLEKPSQRRGRSLERSKSAVGTEDKKRNHNPLTFIRKILRRGRLSDELDISYPIQQYNDGDSKIDVTAMQAESFGLEPEQAAERNANLLPREPRRKVMRSPPSNRAKKYMHSQPAHSQSTDSSSDGNATNPRKSRFTSSKSKRSGNLNTDNSLSSSETTSDFGSNSLKQGKKNSSGYQSDLKSQRSGSSYDDQARRCESDATVDDLESRNNIPDSHQYNSSTMPRNHERKMIDSNTKQFAEDYHQKANRDYSVFADQQQLKYRTLVSLNSQTLKKITEKWLTEWRNQLPVGGFLITSWSDVILTSKHPRCFIGNTLVYDAKFATNPDHKLACQMFPRHLITHRVLRQLENCATLTMHPNVGCVCSHFCCRIPNYLLDPMSSNKDVDALCVVLGNRPAMSIIDYLNKIEKEGESNEVHRQILLILIQVFQGLNYLSQTGFNLPFMSVENLIVTQDHCLVQILPYMSWNEDNLQVTSKNHQNADSFDNPNSHQYNPTSQGMLNQVTNVLQWMINYINIQYAKKRAHTSLKPGSAPNSKYSYALRQMLHYVKYEEGPKNLAVVTSLAQCALWGPTDLADHGRDYMSITSTLELWIEMEQAKLVNSLAVLLSGAKEPMSTPVYLKYQYFSQLNSNSLITSLDKLKWI